MRTADQILTAYRAAMIAQDADALADLYRADAVHTIPFAFPGLPERFEGREALRAGYRRLWSRSASRPREVAERALHRVPGSNVVITQQSVIGTLPATGQRFEVRGVLVLVIEEGLITEARDYLDAGALTAGARAHQPTPDVSSTTGTS